VLGNVTNVTADVATTVDQNMTTFLPSNKYFFVIFYLTFFKIIYNGIVVKWQPEVFCQQMQKPQRPKAVKLYFSNGNTNQKFFYVYITVENSIREVTHAKYIWLTFLE